MQESRKRVDEEIEDLKSEMESFKREKERVRAIVGKIGGMPNFNTKIFNIIFIVLILLCLVVSLMSAGILRLAMLELAIAALSGKLIFLIHNQSRVNHFQLWILSSVEWQLNEILKEVKKRGNL